MKEETLRRLLARAETAPLNWPLPGSEVAEPRDLPLVVFRDRKTYDLGPDPTGDRFGTIADRTLSGHYYPPDAVRVYGRFQTEGRNLRMGDRILQEAPMLGKLGGPRFHSSAEIHSAECEPNRCLFGYVTTKFHHGRGIWTAILERVDERLSLTVESTACPHSWLFWLGLPIARYLQLRARRRAVEEFLRV